MMLLRCESLEPPMSSVGSNPESLEVSKCFPICPESGLRPVEAIKDARQTEMKMFRIVKYVSLLGNTRYRFEVWSRGRWSKSLRSWASYSGAYKAAKTTPGYPN
jgi:hypothetical protein